LRVHKLDQNGHSTAEMFTHEVDIKGRGVIITCPQTTTDYIAQEGEVCPCKIKKKSLIITQCQLFIVGVESRESLRLPSGQTPLSNAKCFIALWFLPLN